MDYEIEFHAVGDASRAGDAITVRYGSNGSYEVMVIDGGTEDSGAAIVEHIREHYGYSTVISHVVSSHPDSDHASGLREILRNFQVGTLWIHGLWDHAGELLPLFADKRWTADGLATSIRQNYPIIEELRALAAQQGTVIKEPFAGEMIGPFGSCPQHAGATSASFRSFESRRILMSRRCKAKICGLGRAKQRPAFSASWKKPQTPFGIGLAKHGTSNFCAKEHAQRRKTRPAPCSMVSLATDPSF